MAIATPDLQLPSQLAPVPNLYCLVTVHTCLNSLDIISSRPARIRIQAGTADQASEHVLTTKPSGRTRYC